MQKKLLTLLLLTPLSISTVNAEDLFTVYTFSQENDLTLQAAKEAQLATREAKPQANAQFLPTVNAAATQSSNAIQSAGSNNSPAQSLHYHQSAYGLTLSQPIFYYKEWVQYAKANSLIKQANATYAAAEQDLIVRTTQRYFNVLKAIDSLKFAKANRLAFAKFLEQTEQRFKVGLIAITDVQIAKAQHDSAHAEEIAAENFVADQKEQLQEMTGQPIQTFSSLRDTLALKTPDPIEIEKWVTTALAQNFGLQAARAQVEATHTDIKLSQGNHLPAFSVNGSINRATATPMSTKNTNSAIGLQVSLPIFSGGSISSKTRQAMHTYQHAQKQMGVLHRQVESNTRQSYRGVLTQISQITALKQAIVSNASALKATLAAFDVGTRTIADVLTAQSNLIHAEQKYANARYDYILHSIKLKEAAGTLSPEDIQHINQWLTQ